MDIALHYEEHGQGDPIVLLHGNGESGAAFVNQVPLLEKRFRVIAVDSRGQGQSPRGTAALTISQFADDVHALFEKLGLDQAILFGFSDGANIAMQFAVRYPERVHGLILNGGNITTDGLRPEVFEWITGEYEASKEHADRSEADYRHMELFELMTHDLDITMDDLDAIAVPTLVIAGTNDMIEDTHTREIAAHIPGAELALVEGDHFIASKKPEGFNPVMMDFLDRAFPPA